MLAAALLLGAFGRARAEAPFRVGVMSGDAELLMEQVAIQAKALGLPLKVVAFSDCLLPNEALAHGDLDVKAFQHQACLDNQVETRGYHIVPVAFTVVAPIALYSRKVKSLADLSKGARIGIPNDPSNGGRGLNLLASRSVITLRPGAGIAPTILDITGNPRDVRIGELDSGIIALPRRSGRRDRQHRLGAQEQLWANLRIGSEAIENNPYRNVIAVHAGHENDPRVKLLVVAYHADAVRGWIIRHYQGR